MAVENIFKAGLVTMATRQELERYSARGREVVRNFCRHVFKNDRGGSSFNLTHAARQKCATGPVAQAPIWNTVCLIIIIDRVQGGCKNRYRC